MKLSVTPTRDSRWFEPSAPMFTFVVTAVDAERKRATIRLEGGGMPLERPFSDFGSVLRPKA